MDNKELTHEERAFLYQYNLNEKKLTKEDLAKLHQKKEINDSIRLSNILSSIIAKTGLHSFIEVTHTSHIPLHTKGKFHFDGDKAFPIELYKSLDNFQLWKIISHRDTRYIKKNLKGNIVYSYHNVNYGFHTVINDIFHLEDDYIKTSHASIKPLTQRKNPRIPFDMDIMIEANGKKTPAKIENISEYGMKIVIENRFGMFHANMGIKLHLRFKREQMEIEAKIIYAGLESLGLFVPKLPQTLLRYVQQETLKINESYNESYKQMD